MGIIKLNNHFGNEISTFLSYNISHYDSNFFGNYKKVFYRQHQGFVGLQVNNTKKLKFIE